MRGEGRDLGAACDEELNLRCDEEAKYRQQHLTRGQGGRGVAQESKADFLEPSSFASWLLLS